MSRARCCNTLTASAPKRCCARQRPKARIISLAISQRKSLSEDVTDALLARGNREVARTVASNSGARLSDSGFWKLVQRSENDIVLTLATGSRKDIPRLHFQKLIARASDEVKSRLAAVNPAEMPRTRSAMSSSM